MYTSLSEVCEDEVLDRGVEKEEIAKYIQNLSMGLHRVVACLLYC